MRVLLIGPAWVGDMVMAHSLVQVLAAADPALELDLVAPAATAPLAARMPEVAAAHVLPLGHGALGLATRRGLGRDLRQRRFDQAIVLPNTWKSALIPWFARIPRRTGWRGEWRHGLLNDIRSLNATALPRLVDRYVALARPVGAPLPEAPPPRLVAHADAARALAARFRLETDDPVLACCPGSEFGPSKRWPPAAFAALIRQRVAAGWQTWLFGAAGDAPATAAIMDTLTAAERERVHDLAGRTSLLEAVDLLSCCRAAVSNDSGLMHVAGALGLPVVAIYGSSSPAFTPPLGTEARTVSLDLPCAPCFQRHCPLGHLDCLRRLPATRVEDALAALLPTRSCAP